MRKVLNFILIIFILVCIGLLIYSGYQIYLWDKANKEIQLQVEEIESITEVKEVEDNEKTEIINPVEDKENPYWDFIKLKLIDVDISELKKKNSDIVGWIQVAGTNVNYPFVQGSDNEYYLTHRFDKKNNQAGWVFMDYRNNKKDFDSNTILYGHGRIDKTMFGSLRTVIKSDWYSNINNHIVKLSTEYENTLWQVFSTYKIKTTNDYLYINFSSDDDYSDFLDMITQRSIYNYNVTVTPEDKIITLSTCNNDYEKIVLHAKLIKREKK